MSCSIELVGKLARRTIVSGIALVVIGFVGGSAHGRADDCLAPPFSLISGASTPVEVCVGHSRLITVSPSSFFIGDVDIADESFCRRVIRRAHSNTFEIVGLEEGETTLTVWPEEVPGTPPPPPMQLIVVVKVFADRYAALAQFINTHLNLGLPRPEVNIAITGIPLSGKILVSGEVRTCKQLSQVRSYIESAKIPAALLVYEVRVACPCRCATRQCFLRR
jgi:hypothetical protein